MFYVNSGGVLYAAGASTFATSIQITGATGLILQNNETVTNITDGEVAIGGDLEIDGNDDPYLFFDETDADDTDWWIVVDADQSLERLSCFSLHFVSFVIQRSTLPRQREDRVAGTPHGRSGLDGSTARRSASWTPRSSARVPLAASSSTRALL